MSNIEAVADWLFGVVWTPYLFFLLLGCGLIFSIVTKFVQWRALTHGLDCVRGRFDRPEDTGHISHFQALCAALSATIGLGNIAGVGIAVSYGGPGAVFWMWVVGVFGMAVKFVECSLATMFRDVRDVPDPSAPALTEFDAETRTLEYAGEPPPEPGAVARGRGEVRGGPMWYIQKALVDPFRARGHWAWPLLKAMAVLYATVIAAASVCGGNMFQAWNVGDTMAREGVPKQVTGIIIGFLVALVIIGGIRRIGKVASRLVPFMCLAYVAASLAVLGSHIEKIPSLLALIVQSAFTSMAGEGAFAGIAVYAAFQWGLRRALFSNEAGQGSAAIAHAAARTDEPIREGVVAAMGPFIDTIIICTMTALVVLSSGVWNRPPVGTIAAIDGDHVIVQLTSTEDIPERLRDAHYADLADPYADLWIIRAHEPGESPDRLAARTIDVPTDPAALRTLTTCRVRLKRTVDEIAEEEGTVAGQGETAVSPVDLGLAVGQAVHLGLDGAQITRFAIDTLVVGAGRWIILAAVCLFAFSTMISWSYYGEKGTEYLLGAKAILPYKILYILVIYAGCTIREFKVVYDFSDAMTGLTVFCNLPACLLLLPVLIRAANDYFRRLDSGKMPRLR